MTASVDKKSPRPFKKLNGLAKVIAMFQVVGPVHRKKWLDQVAPKAPWLKLLVDANDFSYRDIIRLERISLHKAFTEIDPKLWIVAFFWTPLSLQKHILLSLPQGRRSNFIDTFTHAQKPTHKEVVLAQFQIAKMIHEKIQLGLYKLASKPIR